jgi:hypothetical protein
MTSKKNASRSSHDQPNNWRSTNLRFESFAGPWKKPAARPHIHSITASGRRSGSNGTTVAAVREGEPVWAAVSERPPFSHRPCLYLPCRNGPRVERSRRVGEPSVGTDLSRSPRPQRHRSKPYATCFVIFLPCNPIYTGIPDRKSPCEGVTGKNCAMIFDFYPTPRSVTISPR